MARMFDWYERGELRPHVSGSYPLAEFARALRAVVARVVKGKVVLTMP